MRRCKNECKNKLGFALSTWPLGCRSILAKLSLFSLFAREENRPLFISICCYLLLRLVLQLILTITSSTLQLIIRTGETVNFKIYAHIEGSRFTSIFGSICARAHFSISCFSMCTNTKRTPNTMVLITEFLFSRHRLPKRFNQHKSNLLFPRSPALLAIFSIMLGGDILLRIPILV